MQIEARRSNRTDIVKVGQIFDRFASPRTILDLFRRKACPALHTKQEHTLEGKAVGKQRSQQCSQQLSGICFMAVDNLDY